MNLIIYNKMSNFQKMIDFPIDFLGVVTFTFKYYGICLILVHDLQHLAESTCIILKYFQYRDSLVCTLYFETD